jgi:hypothetical protein
MTVVAMPEVRGDDNDPRHTPSRVRNARKAMTLAAVMMSIYLLGSICVTTLLVPPEQLAPGGQASDRALAYVAHGGRLTTGEGAGAASPLFGPAFGSLYDLMTV